jgi:hypothetical protein
VRRAFSVGVASVTIPLIAMGYRRIHVSAVVLLLGLSLAASPMVRAAADTLPAKLSDEELWKLSQDLSEQDGYFRSDNLLSNELWLQWVIPDLLARTKPGGVYLGVGPEQNFTYISALKPKMVFITDIRRGNLHTQLMYKALFEMSTDRADFIGRLFTKPRPDGLTTKSSAREIMDAYWDVNTSMEPTYRANLQAIFDHLTKRRKLPLQKPDLDGIEWVYYNFWWYGPIITYNSSTNAGRGGGANATTYYDLMTATDASGASRSYLASEENFKVLKDLHEKNLIVPAVGDFGGPKALRAVGKYIRDHGSAVMAFYLSNVEQYLRQDGKWNLFCANVASMPLDEYSTFIRSGQGYGGGGGRGLSNTLGSMLAETRGCAGASIGLFARPR